MLLKTGLVVVLLMVCGLARAAEKPVQSVAQVDLNRYAGRWFEIARYPNWFQRHCTCCTTATYSLLPDGKIKVINECTAAGGKLNRAEGKAKVADPTSKAKLKVTFFWPFYGDYWILDLGHDYEYAVVGEPSRKYLWILSRTASMNEELYQAILQRLRLQGYDPAKLITTKQSAPSK